MRDIRGRAFRLWLIQTRPSRKKAYTRESSTVRFCALIWAPSSKVGLKKRLGFEDSILIWSINGQDMKRA